MEMQKYAFIMVLLMTLTSFFSCSSESDKSPVQSDVINENSSSSEFMLEIDLEDGEVYNPKTGEIWMDRNLGASRVATSRDDSLAYGDLYQWGRATDGHEKRTSSGTLTLSDSDDPGHKKFILSSIDNAYDWLRTQNDNLWQGVDGVNNPCPNGYRLPVKAEWDAEIASWEHDGSAGAFASPLKLTITGKRLFNGEISYVTSAFYWSSTVSERASNFLNFDIGNNTNTGVNRRVNGCSVRCIKD